MLWDAARKIIDLSQEVSKSLGLSAWRQHRFNRKQIKIAYRQAQKIKHSTSKDEEKKKERTQQVIQAHQIYCDQAKTLIEKAEATVSYAVSQLAICGNKKNDIESKTQKIQVFIAHAKRQIDQIERRVIHGKSIPHDEKVFSLFAEHTEWISKGKAGVPVELGLRVCILEDQHGFMLHHKVMEKTTDDQIAVSMVVETQSCFPSLRTCSFDKGFHSPDNQESLKEHLDLAVLPKKGRRNKEEALRECSEAFKKEKRQHSAVESGINALEVHGLDKCRDKGIDGFKRYVSLAVLARNIQKLGADLRKRERLFEMRRRAA